MVSTVKQRKVIGIVGGMGPFATVELFRLIVENTAAEKDSDHIRILIDNNTCIPDRTNAILNGGESPVPYIIDSANNLKRSGADFILIPCNTSHYFIDRIRAGVDIPVINMVEQTCSAIKERDITKVGILATTGTMKGKIYERYLYDSGIDLIKPSPEQQKAVMSFIYDGVKAWNINYNTDKFQDAVDDIYSRGAQSIIMACTELSLGAAQYNIRLGNTTEPMNILARYAITQAGYEVVR